MPDPVTIVNPKSGEHIPIDPSELDAAVAKGYVSAADYKGPPADVTPLVEQAKTPEIPATQVAPSDQKPNVSDADLTPDGNLRVFNPETGEETHVSTTGTLTDLQAVRDKGYVLRSDYLLAKSQQTKDEAAAAEKEAKLSIEGYGQEQLKQGLEGKSPILSGLEYGAAETGKGVISLAEHLIPGVSQGQIQKSLTGLTPEQIAAEEKAQEEHRELSAAGTASYWISRLGTMLGPMELEASAARGAVGGLAKGVELGAGAAARAATGAAIGNIASGSYGTLRTLQNLNEAAQVIRQGAQFAGLGAAAAAQYPQAASFYKTAIEGAGYSIDDVVDKLAKGDPKGAAEVLALGIGTNVGIHGIFSIGSKLAAGAEAEAAKEAEYLASDTAKKNAQQIAGKMFDLSPEVIAKDGEKLGPIFEKAGITKEDLFKDGVGKINTLIKEGEPEVAKAYEVLDRAPSKTEILQDALYKSESSIKGLTADLVGPMKEDAEKSLGKILEQVGALGEKEGVSFADISKLKEWLETLDNKNPLIVGAKSAIRSNIINAENEALYSFATDASKSGNVAKIANALSTEKALYDAKQLFGDAIIPKTAKTAAERASAMPAYLKAGVLVHALAHPLTGIPHLALHVAKHTLMDAISGLMKEAAGGAGKESFGRQIAVLQGTATPMKNWIIDAQKALDSKLGQSAKELFSALASKEAASHTDQINHSITNFLPTNGTGQSRDRQIDVLRRAVGAYTTNPTAFASHLNTLTAPLRQEGLHQVADEYSNHALRMMKVIQAVIPKDPSMMQSHPFAANVQPEDISPATKAKYERALTIAADPVKLLGLVKSNTITPMDVAIAAASNPQTLQRMRDALVAEGLKNKPDLTYQQRISMSILMGTNIQESTFQLAPIQSTFVPPIPQGSTGSAPAKGGGKGLSAKSQDNIVDANLPTSAKGAVAPR